MKYSFNLFKNKFKEAENHPDLKTRFVCTEDFTFEKGKVYDVVGWNKMEEKGLISIQISETPKEYADKFKERMREKKAKQKEDGEGRSERIFPDRKEKEEEEPPIIMPPTKDDDLPF